MAGEVGEGTADDGATEGGGVASGINRAAVLVKANDFIEDRPSDEAFVTFVIYALVAGLAEGAIANGIAASIYRGTRGIALFEAFKIAE